MPPRLAHVVSVPPPHELTAAQVEAGWSALVGGGAILTELQKLIAAAAVSRRQLVEPVEALLQPRAAGERNRLYKRHALAYGEQALRRLFAETGLAPGDVDALITVSCTGLLIPSLDAYLINRLGIRNTAVRLPITELGCAAGVAALARAREFTAAHPGASVAVVAVEFPSLTLNIKNTEPVNVVSSVLFGDGAAAALVSDTPGPGLRLVAAQSELYPDTEYLMGFELSDDGLQVVLDRAVPRTVRERIRGSVTGFLAAQGRGLAELAFVLLHPGGRKLVDHIERELGLTPAFTALSRSVLRDHGNMSSATVLYVLERFLRGAGLGTASGAPGLVAAMGPGFSVEQLLVHWEAG
jgi:predicted naringenin-chalcone synthase